ncbi:MAG: hypothetical protein FGM58_10935, partial [Acidimicrobiia bacterium]|nr:hypothetical protein [Acidimicrobiia bacterium]
MTTETSPVGRAGAPRRRSGTVAPASRAMTAGISLAATASIVAALALSAQSPASGAPSTVELDVTSGARPSSTPVVDTGAAIAVDPPSAIAGSPSVTVPIATTPGAATTPAIGPTAPATSTPATVAPAPVPPPPTSPP